jgi:micrococcal nuclease
MITSWVRRIVALALCVCLGARAPALAADPQSHKENCQERQDHCLPSAAEAQPISTIPGTVTRVVDGDTIIVQLQTGPIRVRLYGIDAPESTQPEGGEATAYLAKRIAHQPVELEPYGQDRYNRMVAIVYLQDEDVNETMVQQGFAWAYRRYLKRSDTDYCYYEQDARKAHLGLWSLPAAEQVAPWEYRHQDSGGPYTDYSAETAEHCIAELGRR